MSERDEAFPLERGLTYQRGYEINRATALDNLRLTGGGAAPVNVGANAAAAGTSLGALSPSAGGNLGDLSPSAGGLPMNNSTTCVNAYLDSEWNVPAAQRNCVVEQTNGQQ